MFQIIGIFIISVIFVFAIKSIKIVDQSDVLIIQRLGKYFKTCKSGLNFINPILDSVRARVDLRTQVVDTRPQEVITKDNVRVTIDSVMYYRVTDAFKSVYEVKELIASIKFLTITTLRDRIGDLTLEEVMSGQDSLSKGLRSILDLATDPWGVKVEKVKIKDIKPQPDVIDAMEKQMKAEREKRAMISLAKGQKESAIAKAEGEKQSSILEAEGKKESAILEAEAEKEAKIRRAEGEALAIETVALAEAARLIKLKDVGVDPILTKQLVAFETMANSQNKVFVPVETSGVMGSVGAIKELISGK